MVPFWYLTSRSDLRVRAESKGSWSKAKPLRRFKSKNANAISFYQKNTAQNTFCLINWYGEELYIISLSVYFVCKLNCGILEWFTGILMVPINKDSTKLKVFRMICVQHYYVTLLLWKICKPYITSYVYNYLYWQKLTIPKYIALWNGANTFL